jgi:hypothetical protein
MIRGLPWQGAPELVDYHLICSITAFFPLQGTNASPGGNTENHEH